MGYMKPGQVLNKLYYGGPGPGREVLAAWKGYQRAALDWAGPAAKLPGAERWWKLVPQEIPRTLDLDVFPTRVGEWVARLPPPPPPPRSGGSEQNSGGAAGGPGIVSIPNNEKDAVPLLLAALARDGCAILQNAVSVEVCQAVMRELQPYAEDPETGGATVGSVISRSAAAW